MLLSYICQLQERKRKRINITQLSLPITNEKEQAVLLSLLIMRETAYNHTEKYKNKKNTIQVYT
jgi:hypothetical protein